jgi:phosphoribosyl 1,2-cyclic phosphate phosphodiesterase
MKVTILGCGAAPGVPALAGGWGACDSTNPKNRRRRSSVLIEQGGATVLIDTTPDLREQLLEARTERIDAVLYTHGHADHTHGIDELREINRLMRGAIPVYGDAETLRTLETRFGYCFEGIPEGRSIFRPWLKPNVITTEWFSVGAIPVRPFLQDHGVTTTLGFRLGDFAYSTDVLDLPDAARAQLRDLAVWVVGALSDIPHPAHAHLEKVLDWIAELKPRRAVITHMSNALDYETLMFRLPVGVTPAFDGMQIEV